MLGRKHAVGGDVEGCVVVRSVHVLRVFFNIGELDHRLAHQLYRDTVGQGERIVVDDGVVAEALSSLREDRAR